MRTALEVLVWDRAQDRCEYCQLSQEQDTITFEIDHVTAQSHGGLTKAGNLALACFLDNSYKGPNLSGIDPGTRSLARLFNPRRHKWTKHFRWDGPTLQGLTAIGRATIATLKMNLPHRVAHRAALIDEGAFPPNS